MRRRFRRVALAITAVAVVAIAGGVTYAVADIGGGGVINGCYKITERPAASDRSGEPTAVTRARQRSLGARPGHKGPAGRSARTGWLSRSQRGLPDPPASRSDPSVLDRFRRAFTPDIVLGGGDQNVTSLALEYEVHTRSRPMSVSRREASGSNVSCDVLSGGFTRRSDERQPRCRHRTERSCRWLSPSNAPRRQSTHLALPCHELGP